MRRTEPRDKMLNIRFSERELNKLEHRAIEEHSYTASMCRQILLDAIDTGDGNINVNDGTAGD